MERHRQWATQIYNDKVIYHLLNWTQLCWVYMKKCTTSCFSLIVTQLGLGLVLVLLLICSIMSANGLSYVVSIDYLFRNITYHLDPVLSASQPHGSGTNSLSAFAKPGHFLFLNAILRLIFSSQLTPPPSDPPSNAPWFFNRLWRYISFVLTYFLTYLLTVSLTVGGGDQQWNWPDKSRVEVSNQLIIDKLSLQHHALACISSGSSGQLCTDFINYFMEQLLCCVVNHLFCHLPQTLCRTIQATFTSLSK